MLAKPFGVLQQAAEEHEVQDALVLAVDERREVREVVDHAAAKRVSSSEKPVQSVAQNTKLCSLAMSRTLPASTSSWLPSRPWPYSEIRAGTAGAAPPVVAAYGMMQR